MKWQGETDACYRGTRISDGVWLEKAKGVFESKGKNVKLYGALLRGIFLAIFKVGLMKQTVV